MKPWKIFLIGLVVVCIVLGILVGLYFGCVFKETKLKWFSSDRCNKLPETPPTETPPTETPPTIDATPAIDEELENEKKKLAAQMKMDMDSLKDKQPIIATPVEIPMVKSGDQLILGGIVIPKQTVNVLAQAETKGKTLAAAPARKDRPLVGDCVKCLKDQQEYINKRWRYDTNDFWWCGGCPRAKYP